MSLSISTAQGTPDIIPESSTELRIVPVGTTDTILTNNPEDINANPEILQKLQDQIENLLIKRKIISRKVGAYKAKNNINIPLDPTREDTVKEYRYDVVSSDLSYFGIYLDRNISDTFWQRVIDHSKLLQIGEHIVGVSLEPNENLDTLRADIDNIDTAICGQIFQYVRLDGPLGSIRI